MSDVGKGGQVHPTIVSLLSVGADGGGYTSSCTNKDMISLCKIVPLQLGCEGEDY